MHPFIRCRMELIQNFKNTWQNYLIFQYRVKMKET